MLLSQCSENIGEKEKNLYFAPSFKCKTHQIANYDPARMASSSKRMLLLEEAGLPRHSPAPVLEGPAGTRQDGPGALKGLQLVSSFGLEGTCDWPGKIPLLVLPAQLGDKQEGDTMKLKAQNMRVLISPAFAHRQVFVHHWGTFQTSEVTSSC